MLSMELFEKISQKYAMSLDEFLKFGSALAIKEKKRLLQIERLEMLARYKVNTVKELEQNIGQGEIQEHPGWEDLIEIKNIEAEIEELDNDIRALQAA